MSFGAWDELCQFLEQDEKLKLQILNPFCYKTAVSRVQVKIDYSELFKRHYFVLPGNYEGSLIVSLKRQGKTTIVDEVRKMDSQIEGRFKSIQVGKDIFLVECAIFLMYMFMNDGHGNFTEKLIRQPESEDG